MRVSGLEKRCTSLEEIWKTQKARFFFSYFLFLFFSVVNFSSSTYIVLAVSIDICAQHTDTILQMFGGCGPLCTAFLVYGTISWITLYLRATLLFI